MPEPPKVVVLTLSGVREMVGAQCEGIWIFMCFVPDDPFHDQCYQHCPTKQGGIFPFLFNEVGLLFCSHPPPCSRFLSCYGLSDTSSLWRSWSKASRPTAVLYGLALSPEFSCSCGHSFPPTTSKGDTSIRGGGEMMLKIPLLIYSDTI